MRTQDLGFDRAQLVVLDFDGDAAVQAHAEAIRQRLAALPGVLSATASSRVPGERTSGYSMEYEMAEGASQVGEVREYAADPHFSATYDVPLVAGRMYTPADTGRVFVLNEMAVARMGWRTPEEALGRRFGFEGNEPGEVIGVVHDFHYRALH